MSAPVSFAQFLVSLGSSAMVHLGETADPATGGREANPMMAKHTLDVLELLRTKTRGNLDEDEARLLDALIGEVSEKLASLQG